MNDSVSAHAPQQSKNINYMIKIYLIPQPPILHLHLREIRGNRRRDILMEIKCMGIACTAIFRSKSDKNDLRRL
jgi:hypothetical protein